MQPAVFIRVFGPSLVPRIAHGPCITVIQNRELASEGRKSIHIHISYNQVIAVGTRRHNPPVGIDQSRVATIFTPRVAPYAVDTRNITLVPDGTGAQQSIPHGNTRCRPVGEYIIMS